MVLASRPEVFHRTVLASSVSRCHPVTLRRKINLKHIVLRELVQGDQQKETQLENFNLRDLKVEVGTSV